MKKLLTLLSFIIITTAALAADKYVSSSGDLILKTAVSKKVSLNDALYTTQSGNVGIGQSNPSSYKLQIKSDQASFNGLSVYNDSSDGAAKAGIAFGDHNGSDQNRMYTNAAGKLFIDNLYTNGMEIRANTLSTPVTAIAVNSSGQVGIGTSTIDALLRLVGPDNSNPVLLKASGSTAAWPSLILKGVDSTGNVAVDTNAILSLGEYNSTVKTSLTTVGRVGIGLTAPGAMLHVTTTDKGIWSERNNSAATTKGLTNNANLVLQGWYNVGNHAQILLGNIGTYGTAAIGSEVINNSGNGSAALWFATRAATTDTAPTERMRITESGDIKGSIIGNFGGVPSNRVSSGTTGYYYVDTGIVCNRIGVYEVAGIIKTNIGASFPYSSGFSGTIIVNGVYQSSAGMMAKWTTISSYNGPGTTPISAIASYWYNGSTIGSASDSNLCPTGAETVLLAMTISGATGANMDGQVTVRRMTGNGY